LKVFWMCISFFWLENVNLLDFTFTMFYLRKLIETVVDCAYVEGLFCTFTCNAV
jgi:hypothetical protein